MNMVIDYNTRLQEYVQPMLDEYGICKEVIYLENAMKVFKGMKTKASMII